MSDVQTATSAVRVTFHDDDETPVEFVIELVHSVFKKPLAEAIRFTDTIGRRFAGSIRARLRTRCFKQPSNASGSRVMRS